MRITNKHFVSQLDRQTPGGVLQGSFLFKCFLVIHLVLNTLAWTQSTHQQNNRRHSTQWKNGDGCESSLTAEQRLALLHEIAEFNDKHLSQNGNSFNDLIRGLKARYGDGLAIDSEIATGLQTDAILRLNLLNYQTANKLQGGQSLDDNDRDKYRQLGIPSDQIDSYIQTVVDNTVSDYNELKAAEIHFYPEQNRWDFSGFSLSLKTSKDHTKLKTALSNLFSPDLANRLLDPARTEAITLGEHVIRPPNDKGSVLVEPLKDYSERVERWFKQFSDAKQQFLEGSQATATRENLMTGVFRRERGHNGQTAPEIDRENGAKNMDKAFEVLSKQLGVPKAMVEDLRKMRQAAWSRDSENLRNVDKELSNKIKTLGWSLVALPVVIPAIVAAAAVTGVTTAALATGALWGMGMPALLTHGISGYRAAVDHVSGTRRFDCSYANELRARGPDAIYWGAIFANLPAASSTVAAVGAPWIGQLAGSLSLQPSIHPTVAHTLRTIASDPKKAMHLASSSGFFAWGGTGALHISWQCLQRAQSVLEATEDSIRRELSVEAYKECGEAAINAIFTVKQASDIRKLATSKPTDSQNRFIEDPLAENRAQRAAAEVTGTPLTRFQRRQIERAHSVGETETGLDGQAAGIHADGTTNYTGRQLARKMQELQAIDPETGKPAFTKAQAKQIIRQGITGRPLVEGNTIRLPKGNGKDLLTPIEVAEVDGVPQDLKLNSTQNPEVFVVHSTVKKTPRGMQHTDIANPSVRIRNPQAFSDSLLPGNDMGSRRAVVDVFDFIDSISQNNWTVRPAPIPTGYRAVPSSPNRTVINNQRLEVPTVVRDNGRPKLGASILSVNGKEWLIRQLTLDRQLPAGIPRNTGNIFEVNLKNQAKQNLESTFETPARLYIGLDEQTNAVVVYGFVMEH